MDLRRVHAQTANVKLVLAIAFVLSARFSYLPSLDVAHKIRRNNRYIPSGQVCTPGSAFMISTCPYQRRSAPLTPGFLLDRV